MTASTSDIQQVLAKTQAVEQLYQTQKQQPDNDQQKFASTVQQKMQDKTHQAQETSETDQGKILKDKQDKLSLSFKRQGNKKKKKSDDDSQPEDSKFEENIGQIVDIKI